MSGTKSIKPTESELEILQILWTKGLATVREVHEGLAKFKDVGYTTTLKLMQIMHEKGKNTKAPARQNDRFPVRRLSYATHNPGPWRWRSQSKPGRTQ